MVIQKKTPQRMCVGCQEMKNKKELLRIVRTPDNEVVLDTTGKKSGRGAYLCCNEHCLVKAFKEKRLERALKRVVDPQVYEQLRSGVISDK
jgi:predicted RNA-binding protein YlxR (DUF448 family)